MKQVKFRKKVLFSILLISFALLIATLFQIYYPKSRFQADTISPTVSFEVTKSNQDLAIKVNLDPKGNTACSLLSKITFDKSLISITSFENGDDGVPAGYEFHTIPPESTPADANANGFIDYNIGFPSCKSTSFTAFTINAKVLSIGTETLRMETLSLLGGTDGTASIALSDPNPSISFLTGETKPSTTIDTSACPGNICPSQNPTLTLTARPYNGSTDVQEKVKNIYYKLNGATAYTACPSDAASCSFSASLISGNNVISFYSTDADDHKEISQTATVVYNPPSGSLSITSNLITFKEKPVLTGTIVSDMNRVTISFGSSSDNAVVNSTDKTWSVTLQNISLSNFLNTASDGSIINDGKNNLVIIGYDANGDSKTINATITRRKVGDGSGDGKIDITDFGGLMAQWGKESGKAGYNYLFDFSANGKVWEEDYSGMMANWGK